MPLFESIQNLGLFSAIRESALAYPVILATHLASIGVFGGAILMTDLRLLGLALTEQGVPEVVGELWFWKRIGFVVMVASGVLLAGAKAAMYSGNPYFQVKVGLLVLVGVHAMIFRRPVYRNASPAAGTAKLAAWLSLALWLGIVSAGRLIAYWEPSARAILHPDR